MDIGTIIGGIALLGITVFAVLQPFMGKSRDEIFSGNEQKKRDELLTSYERVLATIRDLDEDHNTGKLGSDAYQSERAYWTEQGITLLQQLEPQEEERPARKAAKAEKADTQLDDAVEKAIADYRKAKV